MRRSRQVAVILAIVAVLALAFYGLRPKPPTYKGKSLEEWMLEGEVPTEVVQAIGVASIPQLITFVGAKESRFEQAIDWVARKVKLHRNVKKTFVLKGRAVEVFRTLGTNGSPAVLRLSQIIEQDQRDDPYSGATAAHCLAHVGESGVRALVDALSHTNWRTRHEGAYGLATLYERMGDPRWQQAMAVAVSAVPALLNCITNDTQNVAIICFNPLSTLAKEIPWVVPSLAGLLQHTNVNTSPTMLRRALRTIGTFGRQAEPATNAVAPFLTHPDRHIRTEATNTLRSLQGNDTSKDSGGDWDYRSIIPILVPF